MGEIFADFFGVTPLFFFGVSVVGVFGFLVSATFGIGGVVLLIPMLSLALPPAQAVALSAPVMLVNNVAKSLLYRRSLNRRALWLVSALSLPTAFVAALLTASVDERVLLVAVAALVVATLFVERVQQRTIRMSDRALLLWGIVTGVISGMCGAAGPPTAIGLRSYGLSKDAFVATVSVFAVALQFAKMPAYVLTEVLSPSHLPLAVWLAVLGLLSVVIGPRILRRVPEKLFRDVVDGILAVSAVWLLIEAWNLS
jgi:uncharacterized membrane protein YfcA